MTERLVRGSSSRRLSSTGWSTVTPVIGVVMGSSSDWPTMSKAVEVLEQFAIAHEARVVSAHRMPDEMFAYAEIGA